MNVDRVKKRRAEIEFALIALGKASITAKFTMTVCLLVFCLYRIMLKEAINNSLYIAVFINVLPIVIAYLVKLCVKKEYELPFPQLARDYRWNLTTFAGNGSGMVISFVLLAVLTTNVYHYILLFSLIVTLVSFLINLYSVKRNFIGV